ncbi:MAG TPA: MarR family transcriptional regulator [Alphaproteobacteria bacterium]
MRIRNGRDTIDTYRLDGAPAYLLRRCLQRVSDLFAEEIGSKGITLRQFMVLLAIHQRPGLSQTDLVAATGIDRSTIGEMVERLSRRGLIERRRSGRDQRSNDLLLLPAGRRALAAAMPAAARAQARLLGPLPAKLRTAFLLGLRHIADLNLPRPLARGHGG